MLAFLEETILNLQKNQTDLSNSIIILPSKRAGGFLKNYLQKHTSKATFAPTIISIEDFIEELSGLQIITAEELLIKSYEAYQTTSAIKHKENFDDYAQWANALLNDFSEIDRYLVDVKAFFDYLASVKTLEKWGVQDEQTELIANYLQFWNNLLPFYTRLNDLLANEQLGYQGMVYRKASEDIEHYLQQHGSQKHVFIGFNALNTAEQHIIQELLETGNTEVFWDVDTYFYNDQEHSASLFMRGYFKDWNYYQNNPQIPMSSHYELEKHITIIEAQNTITQAKHLGTLLADYSEEKLSHTAIVLADESLLIPVLYSLPKNVLQANVTMGVALESFDGTTFFELLLKHHQKETDHFYFKPIVALLQHPTLGHLLKSPGKIISSISENNRAYISYKQLIEMADPADLSMIELLFGSRENQTTNALRKCRAIISLLDQNKTSQAIEKMVWRRLDEVFQRIAVLNNSYDYLNELSTLSSLFKTLVAGISLDFEGDAYNGLQIMGVLETRGLDFENIIMLSVNEGTLPAGKSNASFITYDLKKEFNLPLFTEKDAIYTYHFYRLLHRVLEATFIYSSFAHGLNSGEKSRYLLQLEYEQPAARHLTFQAIANSVSVQPKKLQQIEKNEAICHRLQEIAGKYFSPSALTNYIRNPIDFYYQKILKVNEANTVEETVAYNTLGTVVHNALENLYKPFISTLLSIDLLNKQMAKVDGEVVVQFKSCFGEGDITKGKNLIIFEVAKRYVENLIQLDIKALKDGHQIRILQLEADLRTQITLPDLDFPVFLGGKVDRVDLFDDQIRIIDYKTGSVKQSDVEIVDWESIITDYKYSKAFQVLAYALMMQREFSYNNTEAGVISFKNLGSGFLRFGKKESSNSRTKETLVSSEILEAFTTQLQQLLLEICNPNQPFIEKEISK